MSQESEVPLVFVSAASAAPKDSGPSIVIVRTPEEFRSQLCDPWDGVEWLQVEGLLDVPEVWQFAAQRSSELPLDVVVGDPGAEFSALYRLADVRIVRPVRVTIPTVPGLLKAVRVAASLQLPVRILPEQPSSEAIAELAAAADFYLHDPMVESPIEYFQSALAVLLGTGEGHLWSFLEKDPALYVRPDADETLHHSEDFVEAHLRDLIERQAECATCRWQNLCAGYFKQPDPAYDCSGIKSIFASLETAANEINGDLSASNLAAT